MLFTGTLRIFLCISVNRFNFFAFYNSIKRNKSITKKLLCVAIYINGYTDAIYKQGEHKSTINTLLRKPEWESLDLPGLLNPSSLHSASLWMCKPTLPLLLLIYEEKQKLSLWPHDLRCKLTSRKLQWFLYLLVLMCLLTLSEKYTTYFPPWSATCNTERNSIQRKVFKWFTSCSHSVSPTLFDISAYSENI